MAIGRTRETTLLEHKRRGARPQRNRECRGAVSAERGKLAAHSQACEQTPRAWRLSCQLNRHGART
eukprot:6649053-Lingulodinium_polyedra.AAC.1